MKLNIGETIKNLRKEREITQEEFAEVLGVSCQSVSRWENDSCYPDIELIPTIADFFGISTDRLMGVDETKEKKAVNSYLEAFQEAISKGNIDECIRIARKGVKEFPNNYVLLNKLMYALFGSGDDDGNRPKNSWGDVWLDFDIAKRYALMGDTDNMYEHLHLAVEEAKAFDKFPDEQKYRAVLVGEITEKRIDFETSDTRPLCEILRDKWLIHDELDPFRDTDEFKAIIKELS